MPMSKDVVRFCYKRKNDISIWNRYNWIINFIQGGDRMSKEFEEIVLKKLDGLEMKMDELQAQTNVLQVQTNALQIKTDELQVQTNTLQEEISSTNKVVREIQQDFAKFDYEINTKIDTLFDAYTVNQEKHIFFEEKIASLDAKSFNHDIRISNLENKVLTA